jgi:hypothetical protein
MRDLWGLDVADGQQNLIDVVACFDTGQQNFAGNVEGKIADINSSC